MAGNGCCTQFWFDVWCGEVPLIVSKVTGHSVTKGTTADGLASLPQLTSNVLI